MDKTIVIDGKKVSFRCSSITLAIYKKQFKRELYKDILKLEESQKLFGLKTLQSGDLNLYELETYHRIAWAFAKTANRRVPSPYQWLEEFELFPIYEVFPELLELLSETINFKTRELKRWRAELEV
jgi:hypothetical protein